MARVRGHDRRRRWARLAGVQPRSRDLPGDRALGRGHQARRRRVLPRGRGRHHARARAAAHDARALAEGRAPGHRRVDAREGRRRRLLSEAHPEGSSGLRGDRADRVPLGPPRGRDLPYRGGRRRLGGADGHDHVPSVAGSQRRRRPSGRAAARPGPAAGHGLRRRRARGRRGARAPGRARLHRLPEDLGRPRRPHLRPDRAALDVHGRAPRRDRLRARARAAPAGPGDDQVVEGGARRAHLRRLQPERARSHHRLGLQRAAEGRRAGLGTADMGRARRGRARGLHGRDDAGALRRCRRSPRRDRRRRPLAAAAAGHVRARRGGRHAVPARLPQDAGGAEARSALARPRPRRAKAPEAASSRRAW